MMITIGSDHAGLKLKNIIIEHLKDIYYEVNDVGTYTEDSCDYPDYGHLVAKSVADNKCDFGIVVCGSGNGINMAVNKWSEVRSALCWNSEIAYMARLHNDANVLALPGRFIEPDEAISAVDNFMNTKFEGGRHANRVNKINNGISSVNDFKEYKRMFVTEMRPI